MKLIKDILFDATNHHLDAGRVIGVLSVLAVLVGAVANYHLGKELDLGPTGLPGGLATILAAASLYIIGDRKVAK